MAGYMTGNAIAEKCAGDTRVGGQVQGHATQLHDLAARLDKSNTAIEMLLDRLFGPRPPEPTSANPAQPDPTGALMVAAFGAERIRLQADRLETLIGRLDGLA